MFSSTMARVLLLLALALPLVVLASKPYYSVYQSGSQWLVKPGRDSVNVHTSAALIRALIHYCLRAYLC